MTRVWQHIVGGMPETAKGIKTNLLGAAEDKCTVPGVRSRGSGMVTVDAPLESTHHGTGGAGPPPPPPR